MIDKISLKNFKCFNNHSIEFRPFTIIAGANACGKSSIIQAILLSYYTAKENLKNNDILDINKPFNLNLGKSSNLRSNNPIGDIDKIVIELTSTIDTKEENKFVYIMDQSLQPPVLKSIVEKMSSNTGLHQLDYLYAERIGPRRYTGVNDESFFLGYNGEYTSYVVEQADMIGYKINENLVIEENSKHKFSAQVEAWLSIIIDNVQLQFRNNSEFGLMQNYMQNSISKAPVLPTATGFGISYALPIVVAGLLASGKKNPVLVIENPEAHLHPAAQSNIGKFLAVLSCNGVQVIIETHSEHIIDGARIQLTKDKQVDSLKIDFFNAKDGEIEITSIDLNKNGELSEWPEGFFDQRQINLRELMEIKRNGSI